MLKIDLRLTDRELQERIVKKETSEMGLGSIGLLLQLLTTPNIDTKKFSKNFLYRRNKRDIKEELEESWNKLLECNYLLEYKKYNSQSKCYYIVTDLPFSPERIKDYDTVILDAVYVRKK